MVDQVVGTRTGRSTESASAHHRYRAPREFRVTHPFHPLSGRCFELVIVRQAWGEPRVYYHDDVGKLCSMPAAWTTEAPADPFVIVAEGRSLFHIADLLRLAKLIRGMR
ncbi:MAG: hypothetical protein HY334_05455 [Armatimonadetes bacterium]|nr:hypothetical protein [Armatimonadota bacterium]